ncbi:MAG: hypothetical protein PHU64_04475 [Candidatus Omnitrophica bacterium]|nr:hypothetical protein [Candidatus Omnitrophota bacterium]MDD5429434.1 hypothetical protein [Candidatus Omnitrophota bacterium]
MASLKLQSVNIKIDTNNAAYSRYLKTCFANFTEQDNVSFEYNLKLEVLWEDSGWKKYLKGVKTNKNFSVLGANTFLSDNRFLTVKKIGKSRKIIFDFKNESGQGVLRTIIRKKEFKDFFRYKILKKSQEEWFFSLTYPALYYPLFWHLERSRGMGVLHASGFSAENKGFIICGLEGIGKTSLALSFLESKDAIFLSDNLLFYDKEKIYPCYEPVRIHRNEKESLWQKNFEKINGLNILKGFYRPKFEVSNDGIAVDFLIFPEFSQDFCVKEISSFEAVNRALFLSYIPAELSNYSEYRNLYNLLEPEYNSLKFQQTALLELLRPVKCFRVGMPKADGIKKNFSRLKESILNG